MHQHISQTHRICAIAPTARGFGFAVMEAENSLIAFGSKRVRGNKNEKSMNAITKLFDYYRPEVVVLPDVTEKDVRRATRIKVLHRLITELANSRKLEATKVSGKRLRAGLLGGPRGTKHQMAGAVAAQFPNELASLLPSKRRAWEGENANMDMFDAMGLLVAFCKRQ